MNNIEPNRITKIDFLNLNEKDVMFITNPGRMGDEDGSTFVVKNGNEFTAYRVDGWAYPHKNEKEEDKISWDDTAKQFPKWYETLFHVNDRNYQGKYTHLYMGYGNGLSIDNSIYEEYKPYLDKAMEKVLEKCNGYRNEIMQYAAIFNVWEEALIEMLRDKNITIK